MISGLLTLTGDEPCDRRDLAYGRAGEPLSRHGDFYRGLGC